MAVTSLKPIKARDKREVVKGRDEAAKVGFTDQEARGIFGTCYEYTEEERARIDAYMARKSGDELAYYKAVYEDVPRKMRERQRRAEEKLGLNIG